MISIKGNKLHGIGHAQLYPKNSIAKHIGASVCFTVFAGQADIIALIVCRNCEKD